MLNELHEFATQHGLSVSKVELLAIPCRDQATISGSFVKASRGRTILLNGPA
jgi:hypothetical protein